MSVDGAGRQQNDYAEEKSNPDRAEDGDRSSPNSHDKPLSTPKDQASQLAEKSALQGKEITGKLLPKLLRTTKMLLASRSFFYSYDYDITRRIGDQGTKHADVPLHRSVDALVGGHAERFTAS